MGTGTGGEESGDGENASRSVNPEKSGSPENVSGEGSDIDAIAAIDTPSADDAPSADDDSDGGTGVTAGGETAAGPDATAEASTDPETETDAGTRADADGDGDASTDDVLPDTDADDVLPDVGTAPGTGTGADTEADTDAGTAVGAAAAARTVDAAPSPGIRTGRGGSHTGEAGKVPRPRKRRTWLRWVAGGVGVLVLATAGAGWWFYQKLDGNITTDTEAAAQLQTYAKERPTPVALDALNILLIGSDSRSGKGNAKYGHDEGGTARSDTTILLHLAADRKSATAVSIPRDLMVHIPACDQNGHTTSAQFAQFNWAFEFGGTACTTRTVEQLTGVRIDHEMVVDFSGFKDMVNAVGGAGVPRRAGRRQGRAPQAARRQTDRER